MNDHRILLRATEAAEVLGLSRSLTYQLLKQGELPCVRIGRRSVRVPMDGLLKWARDRARATESERETAGGN